MISNKQIDDLITNWKEPEPFSGVVCLSQGDNIIFEKGYGDAIKSEAIPNRPDTRFQIASGCKIFTAGGICQLVERSKLSFDTLLSQCLDISFPSFAPDITIHHLLTHSSGIRSYFEEDVNPDYEMIWQDVPMYKIKLPADFLPLFQTKPMKFSPGDKFDYNDAGFILLGLVIESITGMNFPEYIRENIFKPAGMNDSGYFPTDQLPERTAYAYINQDDGSWRTNFFAVPIIGGPDGGAYTTGRDMYAFWKALTGRKLLSDESTTIMLDSKIATSHRTPYTHYGYGVWIDNKGKALRKHFVEGFDPGVAFRSSIYKKENIILTIIGNTGSALWPLYEQIEKSLKL
jgi:CubicO group peptidase (beta-lactamase class C family)